MAKLFISSWAKKKSMTLTKLAAEIGIAQPTLSLLVTGKTWPKEETIDKIASALGIYVYQLFIDPENAEGKQSTLICPHCGQPIEVSIKPAE